jgi:hypothetical protein
MREIIYSPDGKIVLRWDRERGYSSLARPGEADTSHLTHTHVSWYRDAQNRDHRTAFRPYWEANEMDSFVVTDGDLLVTVKPGVKLYDNSAFAVNAHTETVPPEGIELHMPGYVVAPSVWEQRTILARIVSKDGKAWYVHKDDVTNMHTEPEPIPPDPLDYNQAITDASAAVEALRKP